MRHPVRSTPDAPVPGLESMPAEPAADVGDGADLALRIREAAYYRYLARGAEIGHDMEDWLQAEAELVENQAVPGPDH